ncbi:hypothetical protein JB92DRAFT_3126588 [Gautieria morchelliformis]|nr:hypothetical protein JB92DRAFT_3126588 [Gautieria morchelliformis]
MLTESYEAVHPIAAHSSPLTTAQSLPISIGTATQSLPSLTNATIPSHPTLSLPTISTVPTQSIADSTRICDNNYSSLTSPDQLQKYTFVTNLEMSKTAQQDTPAQCFPSTARHLDVPISSDMGPELDHVNAYSTPAISTLSSVPPPASPALQSLLPSAKTKLQLADPFTVTRKPASIDTIAKILTAETHLCSSLELLSLLIT